MFLLWQVKLSVVGGSVVWRCCCVRYVCAVVGGSGYVWPNVRSEWLQVVSGRVHCGGSMCICESVCERVTQSTIVRTLMCWLVSWEAGKQAVCTA